MSYKCSVCYLILDDESVVDGLCPYCSTQVTKMCENDHICTCEEDIQSGLWFCDKCGASVCKCGSHSVETLSRITGYVQAVSGFNRAKAQELMDRTRYNPITGAIYSSVDGTPKEYK